MKIVFDLTDLYDHLSGIERYAMELCRHMMMQYPEHSYVLLFKKEVHPAFYDFVMQDQVSTIVLPKCSKLLFRQIILPAKLYTIKADAYLFLAFPQPFLFHNPNLYVALHDMSYFDCGEYMKSSSKWYFRLSAWQAFRSARGLLTISRFSAGRIACWAERLKGVHRREVMDKLSVIRCGISAMQFPEEPRCENVESSGKEIRRESLRRKYHIPERYILSLSTLEPRKNLLLLVKAYEKMLRKNPAVPRLVLAGRTGWKMQQFIESYHLKEQIILPGFIDETDLAELYRGAEVFVFPSVYEGFGLPPLEAMAMGSLVLSSDAASMPEVLGNAAVYFKSGSEEDLQKKLGEALSCSEEEKNLRVCLGRKQAQKYDWNRFAAQLMKKLQMENGLRAGREKQAP